MVLSGGCWQVVLMSWQPPAARSRNGLITGYKIRYRLRGERTGSDSIVTDGNSHSHEITGDFSLAVCYPRSGGNIESSCQHQTDILALSPVVMPLVANKSKVKVNRTGIGNCKVKVCYVDRRRYVVKACTYSCHH